MVSWQADLGLDFSTEIFLDAVVAFANRISNFIYLERDGTEIEGNARISEPSGNSAPSWAERREPYFTPSIICMG